MDDYLLGEARARISRPVHGRHESTEIVVCAESLIVRTKPPRIYPLAKARLTLHPPFPTYNVDVAPQWHFEDLHRKLKIALEESADAYYDEVAVQTSIGPVRLSNQQYPQSRPFPELTAALVYAIKNLRSAARSSGTLGVPSSQAARPAARLVRSAREAEEVAATWMTYLGFGNARVTDIGIDGGIDVDAETGVAQVKMEALPTGRPVVQQTYGAATLENKAAVCFSLAGFTAEAVAWADRADMPLFRFDFQGEPEPVNIAARKLLRS